MGQPSNTKMNQQKPAFEDIYMELGEVWTGLLARYGAEISTKISP